jgi:hypothetical protein
MLLAVMAGQDVRTQQRLEPIRFLERASLCAAPVNS